MWERKTCRTANMPARREPDYMRQLRGGAHLATSHECPIIAKHKMVQTLASIDNIPLFEARAKVNQALNVNSDISSDFLNFPYLKTINKSSQSTSITFSSNTSHNRFSLLDSNSQSDSTPSSASYAKAVTCNITSPNKNSTSRPEKPGKGPQHRSPNCVDQARALHYNTKKSPPPSSQLNDTRSQILISSNGRTPFLSRNGVALQASHAVQAHSQKHNIIQTLQYPQTRPSYHS